MTILASIVTAITTIFTALLGNTGVAGALSSVIDAAQGAQ